MINEINIENIQQFVDLINNDPNDHPLKKMGLLFATAMNDWPTPNQTNINEFAQELHIHFGIPLTKEIILAKTTGFSDGDAWRKESAASLLELLDLADTHCQWKNLQKVLQEIIYYYESQLNANGSQI